MGAKYHNHERFKALKDKGKPLWEFKEFRYRLYCYREQTGEFVKVILLNGWEKTKEGKTKEENAHIKTAQRLLQEYQDLKARRN